ncbi:MarR family transcriptional regulator [Actinoplanes sp. NPDC051851]|uniref:MarR family winged helix-turn-helix transcriptional regulator n=1 Tax=Actinoplanes sp. NPDC051851 TaxID=3154753 RepID=UPI0034344332
MTETDPAVQLMLLAHQLHRALDRRVQGEFDHPKPPEVQLAALWFVIDHPGATVRELADELQIQPNNASALVTLMVKNGLLVREPDQRDRRVVRLHATAEARQRTGAVQGLLTGYLSAALDALDDEARTAVARALPYLTEVTRHVRDGGR